MGWQGRIRRRGKLEHLAQLLGVHWLDVSASRWGDHDKVWVSVRGGPRVRFWWQWRGRPDRLVEAPLGATKKPPEV